MERVMVIVLLVYVNVCILLGATDKEPVFDEVSKVTTTGSSVSTGSVYPSSSAPPCIIVEGMDEPQFIPNKNIRDENDSVPDDVQLLRPDSERPFSMNRRTYFLNILFMPAVRVESIQLIKPENVDSITARYIKPTYSNLTGRPGLEWVSPNREVRFEDMPEAAIVEVRVFRKDVDYPMTFRISLKARFDEVIGTTDYTTRSPSSVHTRSQNGTLLT